MSALTLSPATAPSRSAGAPGAAGPAAPTYPPAHRGLPEPLVLPWALRPVSSADAGIERLPDGRTRCWIRHDVLRGVTPRMLVWWFSHLEGDVEIGGRRHNRYRVWHPGDHVHASYAWRRPDGTIGPGAAIRLREVLGRDLRHVVNVTTVIERLDEGGYVHAPRLHVAPALPPVPGLGRMEYTFEAVPQGTRYENCLILGRGGLLGGALTRALLPVGHGEAWIRHNVEEVGLLEHFLPALYHRETGRRT